MCIMMYHLGYRRTYIEKWILGILDTCKSVSKYAVWHYWVLEKIKMHKFIPWTFKKCWFRNIKTSYSFSGVKEKVIICNIYIYIVKKSFICQNQSEYFPKLHILLENVNRKSIKIYYLHVIKMLYENNLNCIFFTNRITEFKKKCNFTF